MIYGNPLIFGAKGGGSDTYAFIIAAYPAGSTCTASDGTTTLTAPDTSGSWVCKVPNAGTWTVTATDGTDTVSTAVTITTEGQRESVTLSFTLYLIKDGRFVSGNYTHVISGYTGVTVTENYNNLGCLLMYSDGSDSNRRTSLHFTPQMIFPNYRYLVCDFQTSGMVYPGPIPAFGLTDAPITSGAVSPTWVVYKQIQDATSTSLSARQAMFLDVSGVTGSHFVDIVTASTINVPRDFRCFNFYLSTEVPA